MNKLHRLLSLVLALAMSLSLAVPVLASEVETDGNAAVAAAEENDALPEGTVTGFGVLEDNQISMSRKYALEELTAQMPATLPVHVDGVEELVEIPVTWFCLEDYESSNDYYFQFSPQWDTDRWPLAEDLDVELDAPYIAVSLDEGLTRSVSSTKAEVFEYLTQNMGLNQAAACGIMANIEAESSFQVTVSAYDGSGSYGLCQWLGSRLTSLKSWCKANGYNYKTAQGQLHFMEYELSKGYKKVDTYLRTCSNNAQGAYDAAYYWCVYYEIPAKKETQGKKRGNLAKNTYWPIYGGTSSKTPILSGASTPASSIKAGTGVSVYGTITCADKLTKVVAGVYNTSGKMVTGATVTPKATYYNMYELDSKILFSSLGAGKYTYKIDATTASGTYSLLNYSFTVTGITTASVPGQVTGLKASETTTSSVKLTWTKVTGATEYRVFQATSSNGSYTKIDTVTTNSCTVTGLKAGTTYYYQVKAANAAGAGKASSALSAQTVVNVPGQVTGLKASATKDTSVTLTWTKVSGAKSYRVFQASSSDGSYTKIDTVTTNSCTVTGLKANTSYYYKVKAVNDGGVGKASSALSVKTTVSVPGQVTGLKASANKTTSITLTWTKVSGATKYRVFQASTYDGTYTKIDAVTTNSCTITGLKAGMGYYYKIKAVNAAGVGKASSILSTQTAFSTTTQVTTTSALKLRAHAGTSYKSQITVPKGKTLAAICKTTDKKGAVWYKVKYTSGKNTYTGYMHSSWLKVSTTSSSSSSNVQYLITTTSLNLRKGAGTKYSVVKVVPKNTVLTAIGTSGNWYKTKYTVKGKTYTGYLSKSYLSVGKRAETTKATYIYAKTSTGSSKLKKLNAGNRVSVIGSTKVSGTTWYKVQRVSGGKCYTGYCKGSVIEYC